MARPDGSAAGPIAGRRVWPSMTFLVRTRIVYGKVVDDQGLCRPRVRR